MASCERVEVVDQAAVLHVPLAGPKLELLARAGAAGEGLLRCRVAQDPLHLRGAQPARIGRFGDIDGKAGPAEVPAFDVSQRRTAHTLAQVARQLDQWPRQQHAPERNREHRDHAAERGVHGDAGGDADGQSQREQAVGVHVHG
jgi:hypothetical protein